LKTKSKNEVIDSIAKNLEDKPNNSQV